MPRVVDHEAQPQMASQRLLEPEPESDVPQNSSSSPEAEWAGAWAAGTDVEVAASMSRLRTEWMSQRPASSPVQCARDVDSSSHAERLSVDEWCRVATRCGVHFDRGFRRGLEGIALRNEYHTLSYEAVAGWYCTYMKRTILPEVAEHAVAGYDLAALSCCIV